MWKNYVHVAAVIIEGAWKKRYGFKSLLGVVFIISVDTEEVLGFEIKCKHVHVSNVEFVVNGTKMVTRAKLVKSMKTDVP